MWIDTHNHFDFQAFNNTRALDWRLARSLGVSAQFVMSVSPNNFNAVASLSKSFEATYFALGVHPLFISSLDLPTAIAQLKIAVEQNINNPKFIGIGEIGLDGFVKSVCFEQQTSFFVAQLTIAREFDLPVFMHIRKSQDIVLRYCRKIGVERGIAHAFNGSHQQANNYIQQGFKLGFGGVFTFERAKQLRRLVVDLPLEALVLETDAPDMSPAWAYGETNHVHYLPRIASEFSLLRGVDEGILSKQFKSNVESIIERAL